MFKISARRLALIGATAGLGCLAVAGQVQAAGLFDFLFGRPEPARPAVQDYIFDAPALEMRVHPRRQRSEHVRESKPKLATPIDPKANPNWYLDDPTLRRGDIVVLKNKVLVFNGGRGGSMEAFSSLDESSLPKAERTKLRQMAGLQYVSRTAAIEDKAAVTSRSGRKSRSAKRLRPVAQPGMDLVPTTTLSFVD